jgi:hypothetical protein
MATATRERRRVGWRTDGQIVAGYLQQSKCLAGCTHRRVWIYNQKRSYSSSKFSKLR